MMRNSFATRLLLLSVLGAGFETSTVAIANAAEPAPAATLVSAGHGLLEWVPLVESEGMTLTLSNPQGMVRTHHFPQGEAPALSLFDTHGMPLPDGTYTWEVRVTPRGTAPLVQSGYFTISGGNLVAPDLAELPEDDLRVATAPDQMVPDDLIIDGKGCIGLGCVNNEAFGTEALRLKQSVVRLRFQDTSTNAGFPSNDWQITVNDSASGGADRFSIEDVDGNKTPLTIRAGAPDHSLYVDSAGRLGLGTATPGERLRVLENADVNTIITSENLSTGLNAAGALRAKSNAAIVNFQAHGSGRTLSRFGQPLASWAEFLQVTGNGLIVGTLADKPLILGTNNTNRIHIAPNGNVGLGTSTPAGPFHIFGGATADTWMGMGPDPLGATSFNIGYGGASFGSGGAFLNAKASASGFLPSIRFMTNTVDRMIVTNTGNIGIGTTTPESNLHLFGTNTNDTFIGIGPNPSGSPGTESAFNIAYGGASFGRGGAFLNVRADSGASAPNPSLRFMTGDVQRMIIDNEGFLGLGVANPTSPIHHSSGAILTAGGTWQNVSSRDTKQEIAELAADEALKTLQGLAPVKFAYKVDPIERHVGFIAEDVPDLVASPDRKTLSPMDLVAVLTKVVQAQQTKIDELSVHLGELRTKLDEIEKVRP